MLNKKINNIIKILGISSFITFSYLNTQAQEISAFNPIGIFNSNNIPLSFTVSVNGGYDTNVSTSTEDDSSGYISGGVSFSKNFGNDITKIQTGVSLGATNYLDDYTGKDEDIEFSAGGNFSLGYQFSERLAFTNSTNISYGREPNFGPSNAGNYNLNTNLSGSSYNTGASTVSRRAGIYVYGTNSSTLSYKWTPSVYSTLSYSLSGTVYDQNDIAEQEDNISQSIGASLGYIYSPLTSFSFNYGTNITDYDSAARDSQTHTFSLGIQRRLNELLTLSGTLGASYIDSDAGSDWLLRPTGSFNISYPLSQRTNLNWVNSLAYDGSELGDFAYRYSYRSSLGANYRMSERLSFRGSGGFVFSDYIEPVGGVNTDFSSETGLNLGLGLGYLLYSNISFNVGYNFSTYSSDDSNREYDRHSIYAGLSLSNF